MLKHPNRRFNITRSGKKVKSGPHRLLEHLQEISDSEGSFELDAATIAQHLNVSRRSVYLAIAALERQGLIAKVELRRGRGRHSLYRLKIKQKNKPHEIDEKTVKIKCAISKIRNINKHSKDSSRCQGECQSPRVGRVKREPTDYVGLEAAKVTLVLGARFYRQAMKQTRLGLEDWRISEPLRHAIEGFLGNRFDGMTLADARELVAKVWAMRGEIEALARSGASSRRVCSFIAGRLAGKPDRAKREILRRTAELIRSSLDLELIERRIQGLKRFETERELDFKSGHICRRCGYLHTRIEYGTGRKGDGSLNCFGWARLRREELIEQAKLTERRRRELHCRHCGSPLTGGHVEGYCWGCWESLKAPQLPRKA